MPTTTMKLGALKERPEPTMRNLTTAISSMLFAWAMGSSGAMAESCFETRFSHVNQTIAIAANDANVPVRYNLCLTSERIASADILNPGNVLITIESPPDGDEGGCAFVVSNRSLTARLITYEGSTTKATATLNVCVLP